MQALTSMLVTDTVKLLHYGRVVHYGRLVKVKDLPRASLWKLLKNKLEGSRQWQWDGPAGGHRYQEGLNQPIHRWAKAPASQVARGGLK